jgi:2'-hydroxyisoflavone reductase
MANQQNRRSFLHQSLLAGAALPFMGRPLLTTAKPLLSPSPSPAPHPLNILILGGTSFLGPHQIAYAVSRGHSISIFTRGRTQPTIYKKLFKEVEHLVGDRNDNLEALKGRKWDAVIDNSGHRVQWTRDTAQLLKDNVDLYLYTSSTGVYYPYLGEDIKEDTELVLVKPENLNEEQEVEYGYGVMKANSEIEAKKAFGEDRTIVVRPTYMMGPADRTNRFTYWPVRLSRGGEILVPGKTDDPVQYIDVRDVASWMVRLIENRKTDTYNAVGPASPTGMQAFVYGAHAAFSSSASFVWVNDYDFLLKHSVPYAVPWIMPTGENYGSARANNQKAMAHGLTLTPLADSVRDIYEWWHSEAVTEERRNKMVSGEKSLMAREADILAAWKNR